MSAEFVVALPVLVVVLSCCLGSLMLATQRLTLTHAAGEVARLEARGDDAAAALRLSALSAGVTITRHAEQQLHCVTLSAHPLNGLLSEVTVRATGCAAKSEVDQQ